MPPLRYYPQHAFTVIRNGSAAQSDKLALLADMCRVNILTTIKRAGSGHLGSSLSAIDLFTYLYEVELEDAGSGPGNPHRDIFFSSKGHDAPGLYAVLYANGILPEERFLNLRRIDGTCGHPDIDIPGIEANTGSLGMGLSKGRGMAIAKQVNGHRGRVFVMTGDGELQEGQIYEALRTTVNQGISNLHVIVDANKVQSDKPVAEIGDLGDIEAIFRAFGWQVARCDGHDFEQLGSVFKAFRSVTDRPKVLIADTIKGRGVSFMEHPTAMAQDGGIYKWHSGAPDDASYQQGVEELMERVNASLARLALPAVTTAEAPRPPGGGGGFSADSVADGFGGMLLELGQRRKDLLVLDADLAADCRLRLFENAFPERFFEQGIAEQDMVSMAGGLALQGLLPVVNSFAGFLASRANEQIYNNASEGTKIIYACHYAGLLPAGPGNSHQSIRDISLFGALPDCVILQPCNALESEMVLEYCVSEATSSCVIRLLITPSPSKIELPSGYRLTFGKGVSLTEGKDAVLFAYGPVMLNEAHEASKILRPRGIEIEVINIEIEVINMPWLNRFDSGWMREMLDEIPAIFVLDDHAPVGGLGDRLLNTPVQFV